MLHTTTRILRLASDTILATLAMSAAMALLRLGQPSTDLLAAVRRHSAGQERHQARLVGPELGDGGAEVDAVDLVLREGDRILSISHVTCPRHGCHVPVRYPLHVPQNPIDA